MADQLSWSAVGGLLAGFAPEGPLRTAILLVYGLCVAIAPFIYKYYLGILAQGAKEEGSIERHDYDKLRAGLARGNLAARLYAKWLTAFLDGAGRFFGDAGMADRTLFPRAFWLQKPAPLWTAPALDRCLLLALIYPVATIFLIWAISGHVGPAESALGLQPDVPAWQRACWSLVIGSYCVILWRAERTQFVLWLAAFPAITLAVAISFAIIVHGAASSAVGVFVGFGVLVAVTAGIQSTGAVAFTYTIFFAICLSIMVNGTSPVLVLSANWAKDYSGYGGVFSNTVIAVAANAILFSYFLIIAGVVTAFFSRFVAIP
jgi:hypothetical protein